MVDLGVRLQLLIGPNVPTPAPYSVMEALVRLDVRNRDRERDGFQITLTLGKEPDGDYGLVREGVLDPPNRVIIIAIFGVLPQVLIDGIITNHQLAPDRGPGGSTLVVTGEDISQKLDQEEKKRPHPNQSDSAIVTRILGEYARFGVAPSVTPTTDVPIEIDRVPSQRETDLAYVQQLALRNSFVFYIEPTAPFVNTAYWGPENRRDVQSALTFDMGSDTDLEQLSFGFNALGPTAPKVTIVEPFTRRTIEISVPGLLNPALSSQPASPLRTTLSEDTANLNPIQAALRALSDSSQSADAATGQGVLNTALYGRALRPRRLVCVRGAGRTHNGLYYVEEVNHRIERGSYKQDFRLKREGRGAVSPVHPG